MKGRVEGTTDFAGGVSDGTFGFAAMDVDFDGTIARKAWLFFEDGFLAMGAGIESKNGREIFTTLNQCRADGAVFVGNKSDARELSKGTETALEADWVHHDHVGYVPMAAPPLFLRIGEQTGSWRDINAKYPARTETNEVFLLGLDHGIADGHETHACAVLPGADRAGTATFARENPLTILSNTPALQAVRHSQAQIIGAAFFEPATLALSPSLEITPDRPCLVLIRRDGDALAMSVSDPRQETGMLRLTIQRRGNATSTIAFDLPEGLHAGASVTKRVPLQ